MGIFFQILPSFLLPPFERRIGVRREGWGGVFFVKFWLNFFCLLFGRMGSAGEWLGGRGREVVGFA